MLSGPIGSVFTGLENLKELYVFCQVSLILHLKRRESKALKSVQT